MSILSALGLASSNSQTITKNVGDQIDVEIQLDKVQPHHLTSFELVYPEAIMAPIITSGNTVKFTDGTVYSGKETDVIMASVNGKVAVSKMIRPPTAAVSDTGTLLTIHFKALASGKGTVDLQSRIIGLMENGAIKNHDSECTPVDLTIEGSVVVEKVLFKIVVR